MIITDFLTFSFIFFIGTTIVLYLLKFNCLIALISLVAALFLAYKGIFYIKYNVKQILRAVIKEEVWEYFKQRNLFLAISSIFIGFHTVLSLLLLYSTFAVDFIKYLIILGILLLGFYIGLLLSNSFSERILKQEFKENLKPFIALFFSFIPIALISIFLNVFDILNSNVEFDLLQIVKDAKTYIKSDCIIIRVISRIFYVIDNTMLAAIQHYNFLLIKLAISIIYFIYASLLEFIPLYYLFFGVVSLVKNFEE